MRVALQHRGIAFEAQFVVLVHLSEDLVGDFSRVLSSSNITVITIVNIVVTISNVSRLDMQFLIIKFSVYYVTYCIKRRMIYHASNISQVIQSYRFLVPPRYGLKSLDKARYPWLRTCHICDIFTRELAPLKHEDAHVYMTQKYDNCILYKFFLNIF